MAIQGQEREVKSFSKKVGIFEAKVLAINPDREELEKIYSSEVEKDPEYLGEKEVKISEDNTITVKTSRITILLQDVKTSSIFNLSFYLEDRERINKDGTKKQYINNVGSTTWAEDEDHFPTWFAGRDHRVAKVGEEELYNFVRALFSHLDFQDKNASVDLEFKRLIKGDLSILKDAVKSTPKATVVALATIRTVEKDGEVKEYQSVYNRAFLPSYTMKIFRTRKFTDEVVEALRMKKKDVKAHERFIVQVTDPEYGVKDFYKLTELSEYNPDENLAASDKVLEEDNSDY